MIIYNKIIPFKGYKAITIFPFIFTRVKELERYVIYHETIHLHQQAEVLIASFLIILSLVLFFHISPWWLLLSLGVYYALYGLEYLIRLLIYRNLNEAYKNISFEQEAYKHQWDYGYLEERNCFAWVSFLTKKSYEKIS